MAVLVWDVEKLRFATDAAGIALCLGMSIRTGWNSMSGDTCCGGFLMWESSRLKFFPLVSTPKTWTA
jgi:hypothetical protein